MVTEQEFQGRIEQLKKEAVRLCVAGNRPGLLPGDKASEYARRDTLLTAIATMTGEQRCDVEEDVWERYMVKIGV